MTVNPYHYGVAVGINRYPDLRDLRQARGDAEMFAEWLRDPEGGGLPPENVATVVVADDRMPRDTARERAIPTRAEVFNALHKFRKEIEAHVEENPEDWESTRLYFYVSGHGIAPAPEDAALLLANAGPDWYGENVSCSRLIAHFLSCQSFRELVVFADCCRERVESAPLGDVPFTSAPRQNGEVARVLGCATYFGDLAFESEPGDPDQQRGYFTRALLEGLRGQARDAGEINSNSLAVYVRQRVMDLTSHKRYPQKPTMEADPGVPIVFRSATREAKQHEVRLRFVTPFAGRVLLYDGTNRVIAEHQAADGEWVRRLAKGIYQVAPAEAAPGVQFRDGGFFRVWGEDLDVDL